MAGIGRDGNVSVECGIEATRGMHLSKLLPFPTWTDQAVGGVSVLDLPLQGLSGNQSLLKHFVDIINDVPPPDKNIIETTVNSGSWGRRELPEPFCPKTDMDVKLVTQFVVIPQNNGKVCVVTHMYSPDLKLSKSTVEALCYSAPQTLQWQGHAMTFRKGWQWFLEQMGGWQCRQYALSHVLPSEKGRADKAGNYMSGLTEEEVDKGFAFIEEEAGRLGSEWRRVQWTTKNLNINPESPIFGWPLGLVEKSLKAIQTDGVLTLPTEDFYFTLADLDYSFLQFAGRHVIKMMKTHAVGIIGGPGSGKTPLARIIALCASRYWKRVLNVTTPASYRESSEFDFFRGQPGRKDRPDIYDDGCLADEPVRKLKGFTDVGCTMLTKERWGAAKFVKGQFRVFVCNDYVLTGFLKENQDIRPGITIRMSHEDFVKVIAPMFPSNTEDPHIMAVLKRANVIVNAGKIMMYRKATENEVSVPCLIMEKAVDFLKPAAAKRYMQYRDAISTKHADFDEDVKWEAAYVDAILADQAPPLPRPTIVGGSRSPFLDSEGAAPSAAPTTPPPSAAPAVPKAFPKYKTYG